MIAFGNAKLSFKIPVKYDTVAVDINTSYICLSCVKVCRYNIKTFYCISTGKGFKHLNDKNKRGEH